MNTDLSQKHGPSEPYGLTLSRRCLVVGGLGFVLVLGLVLANRYVWGDVVVDMRVGSGGPEMLFRGERSLWVPTDWVQYYWYTAKPLLAVPFMAFFVAIACWHRWETTRNERLKTCEY